MKSGQIFSSKSVFYLFTNNFFANPIIAGNLILVIQE